MRLDALFTGFASYVARIAGRPAAFIAALAFVAGWGIVGPAFGFSDTWQLVVNTGSSIITLLMVFLIQNTQNRESAQRTDPAPPGRHPLCRHREAVSA